MTQPTKPKKTRRKLYQKLVPIWVCFKLFIMARIWSAVKTVDHLSITSSLQQALMDFRVEAAAKQPNEWKQNSEGTTISAVPLIIGAGQGTTGTHSVFCATCHLGIASVHWTRDCLACEKDKNLKQMRKLHKTNANTTSYYNNEPYDWKYHTWPHHDPIFREEHPHGILVRRIQALQNCINLDEKGNRIIRKTTDFQCDKQGFEDMETWLATTKDLIHRAVKRHSVAEIAQNRVLRNVDSVHDTPYTDFLSTTIQAATSNHRKPLVLLSERDPTDWAKRRSYHFVVLCKLDLPPPLQKSSDKQKKMSDKRKNYEEKDDTTTPSGHFDYASCIERTIRAKTQMKLDDEQPLSPNGNTLVNVHETFVLYAKLTRENIYHPKLLNKHMASEFAKHQAYWKSQSRLSWNMFEKKQTPQTMASDIDSLVASSSSASVKKTENSNHHDKSDVGGSHHRQEARNIMPHIMPGKDEWAEDIDSTQLLACGKNKCVFRSKQRKDVLGYLVEYITNVEHKMNINVKTFEMAQRLTQDFGIKHSLLALPSKVAGSELPPLLHEFLYNNTSTKRDFDSSSATLLVQSIELYSSESLVFKCPGHWRKNANRGKGKENVTAVAKPAVEDEIVKLKAASFGSTKNHVAYARQLRRDLNSTLAMMKSSYGTNCLDKDFQVVIDPFLGRLVHIDLDRCSTNAARFVTWSDECSASLQGIIEKTIARRKTILK